MPILPNLFLCSPGILPQERIQAWLATSEVQVTGACWEVYWADPGQVPDPEDWRTQTLFPCEPREEKH